MRFLFALCLLLAGCAAEPVPVPPPAPPVVEELAPIVPPPVTVPDTVASKLVKRDTAAVQQQARAFIVRPSADVEAVVTLAPLTRRVNVALAVMELHHTRRGYRPADVAAARAAADAVAAFLDAQPPPRLRSSAPSDTKPDSEEKETR